MSELRALFYVVVVVLGAVAFSFAVQSLEVPVSEGDLVAQGRAVYIAEGCIHCHSQYVRPVGEDIALWGERTSVEHALAQEPVLIGNRRQGPDLANVGVRRNADWNRLHLINPSQLLPGSRMPSYAHLFAAADGRGEALLAYLDSLKPSLLNTDKDSKMLSLRD
jgi:cbb3-type cytochrome c oxidase subunit II